MGICNQCARYECAIELYTVEHPRGVESLPCHDDADYDWSACPNLLRNSDTGIRRCSKCGALVEEGPCPNCEN